MRVLVMLDGTVANPDLPHIRVDDLGLMRGDGVFETILVSNGHARELNLHLDRLIRSAAMLDLPEPDRAAWERCVQTVIDNWSSAVEFAIKIVYTRGVEGTGIPTGFGLGFEIPEATLRNRERGVSAITLNRGITTDLRQRAPWLLLGAKSLSYAINMAAVRHAAANGADEVIFLAEDGSVLEGPTSTVVIAEGRTLRTPPATIGILPGTTQAALFRAAEREGWSVKVEPLTVEDLRAADGVWLCSSIRAVTQVHTLDGEALPNAERAVELHGELTRLYAGEYA